MKNRKWWIGGFCFFVLLGAAAYHWWHTVSSISFSNSDTICGTWWYAQVSRENDKKVGGYIPGSILSYTVVDFRLKLPWQDENYCHFYYSSGEEQVQDRTIHKDGIYRHGTQCEWRIRKDHRK